MSLKARWTWLEIESDSDISNIEHWFKLGKEDAEAFPYIVIKLAQHFDFTITSQMNYINSISEYPSARSTHISETISWLKKRRKISE